MRRFMSLILTVSLLCTFFVFGVNAEDGEELTRLSFGADGKFTVLQLTDPQEDACLADGLIEFIEKSIEATDPDFIVITGDLVENSRAGDISDSEIFKEGVTVDGNYEQTLENTKKAVAQIFAPLEASGIPYAVTQGNNDYSSDVTLEDWMAIYAEYPNCITAEYCDMLSTKIDYYVPVYSASGEPAFGLWMLDNGKGFGEAQMNWFNSYNNGGVPGVAFAHVPIDDMGNLYEECKIWDEGALISGAKTYRLNGEIAMGHAEGIIEPGATTDVFKAYKAKNVVGAFFGHWHTSGFTGVWDGVTLGMTYGCQFSKLGPYGVRTVTLDEATGTIDTTLYEYVNGEFTEQIDTPYAEYDSAFDKALNAVICFFENIFNALKYALKF